MNSLPVLCCLVLTQVATLATGAIAATTYVVQPGGTGDFATIQLAINAAANGDTITLGNGLFTGDGNRDLDFLGKAIVVRSLSSEADSCVIDCQGTVGTPHRGFWFHSGEDTTAVLAYVTIRGGGGVTRGGGCLVGDPGGNAPASPRIFGCHFESNQAGTGAGAAVVNLNSLPRIYECHFTYNEGSGLSIGGNAIGCFVTDCISEYNTGDGIQTDGVWTGCGSPLYFTRCTLRQNGGAGLGHYSKCGGARLTGCTVADNDGWGVESSSNQDQGVTIAGGSVTGNGAGGVNAYGSYWDSVTGCVIDNNRGHGILTDWDVSLVVSDCYVTGNDGHGITAGDARAAGRHPESDRRLDAQISHCTISGNGQSGISYSSGLSYGAAITDCVIELNGDDGISFTGTCGYYCHLTVFRSTIALNLANGLRYQTDVPGDLRNCIVFGNTGAAVLVDGVAVPALWCCDLFGNGGGDWVGAVAPQLGTNGNFSGDPLFCSIGSDLGLLPESPCAPANNPTCGLVGALPVGCNPLAGAWDVDGEDAGGERSPLRSAPNPFRRSTEIHYKIAHEGPVTIEVFDASGRLIRQLLDAPRPRGAGSVTWDGRDERGSDVSQGLFLVRVSTDGGTAGHRVVLLR